ncbi:MAG: signal peptide peptidase SppA [Bacteroidetes bacterium]|nr:signal peptide peptidase SppA [Bacteroidota bacterium]
MKNFFKMVFAVIVGLLCSFFVFLFIMIGLAAGSGDKKSTIVQKNSILELNLDREIADVVVDNPLKNFSVFNPSISQNEQIGLFELQKTIEKAKEDKNIAGIYLKTDGISAGISTLFEIKRILEDFKKSGKFIIAYTEGQSQGSYLINTAADKIYMNPVGGMELKGFGSEIMYFKGLLDKLGVEPMIFYAGEFKSATEPFRATKMSEENRVQMTALLDDIYGNYLLSVAKSRKMTIERLRQIIDNLEAFEADNAVKIGLIDGLRYYDEINQELMKKAGLKKEKDLKLTAYNDYKVKLEDASKGDKVAVVFAQGDIVDGKGEPGEIGGLAYAETLKEIREDEHVKAVVIRVNSPGGSAYASEQIWRELSLIRAKKIPIVISMGDYAASGGYYIAAPGDYIFADENTITGSIGVFGMMFNTEKLFRDKAGITFDRVKTAPYADFGTGNRPWDEREKEVVTNSINKTYSTFKSKVANGRKLPMSKVDSIARGRVWSGNDAKYLGLIDAYGNLDKAIAKAKELAKNKNLGNNYYPKAQSFFETIIADFTQTKTERHIKAVLGDQYELYKTFTYFKSIKGPQARMPFILNISE